MNEQKESKSLGRLIANLESDPDIQAAIQAKRAAQGLAVEDPGVEPFQQRAFQIVRDARACYEEQNKSSTTVSFIKQTVSSLSFRLSEFLTIRALAPQSAMGAQARVDEQRAEGTIEFAALESRYGLSPVLTVNVARKGAKADVTFVLYSEDAAIRATRPIQIEWVRIGKKNKRSVQLLEFSPESLRAEARLLDAKNAEEWLFTVK